MNKYRKTLIAVSLLCACMLLGACGTEQVEETSDISTTAPMEEQDVQEQNAETQDAVEQDGKTEGAPVETDVNPEETLPEGTERPTEGTLPEGTERPTEGTLPEGTERPTEGTLPEGTERPEGATRPAGNATPEGAQSTQADGVTPTSDMTTEEMQATNLTAPDMGAVPTSDTIYGKVDYIYGNYLSLRLGTMNEGAKLSTGGMDGAGDAAATQDRTAMAGERSSEGAGDRQMPSGESMPSGAGMSGGMTMSSGDTDMSEMITLGDVYYEYTIPVGTTVSAFGADTTFSSITAGLYISLTFNDAGTIVAVRVLG